jgi:hypothetical protein
MNAASRQDIDVLNPPHHPFCTPVLQDYPDNKFHQTILFYYMLMSCRHRVQVASGCLRAVPPSATALAAVRMMRGARAFGL